MKKSFRKIAYTSLIFALSLIGAGFCLQSERTASAATGESADKLLIPQTYEEYLPLRSPASVAVSETHTAIADGNAIYVYDNESQTYRTYTHGTGRQQDAVKKLQFSDAGDLYYADNATGDNFYKLDVTDFSATEIDDIACGTFVLQGEHMYFTNSSGSLYSTTLSAAERSEEKTPLLWDNVSSLAVWNGELYFVRADFYLHKIDPDAIETPDANKTQFATLSQVQSMTIADGVFAYTTAGGDFYAYALPLIQEENLLTHESAGGYTALSAYGDHIYAVRQNAGIVRQYSTQERAFTAKEICASSSAQNRLDGATDACLSGDKLYIADNGNARVSVYDTVNGYFETPIALQASVSHISTDGETLLVSNAAQATLYSLAQETYGETLASFHAFEGDLVGTASVYGAHYLVTDGNVFYALTQDENGGWQKSDAIKNTAAAFTPKHVTADCYGTLYIAGTSNVYAYTEEEFLTANASHSVAPKYSLPQNVKKIAVDFAQTVYAQTDDAVYTLGETPVQTDFSSPLVYVDETTLTALAFGIEHNQTYLLFDGNYIAVTERLHLPTVNAVAVQNADEDVFSDESADFEAFTIDEKALLIRIDLERLNGAEHFPYLDHHRNETARTALKIGETDALYILAAFDKTKNDYDVYLTRKGYCTPLETEYREEYQTPITGYITSDVSLYKFPYLTGLLTVADLPRGTQISLIGEVTQLDYDYYQISYTVDGATKTGYIPQAYVNLFNGEPPASETVVVGKTESDNDSVWRLVYILLGFAVVCILTDYLILRKKREDQ